MVARVFISYRRDDSAGHAGRVHDRLEREFGSDLLFMDVDSIPLGVNFMKVLRDEVAKCEVLLAVIGPNWLNAKDEVGNRRLDNPHDFVRIEIATALQRDISVIPILLDGAAIPKANQLPKDLREIAVRNGLEVRHSSFHSDMEKLIRGLKSPSGQVDASVALRFPSEGHETHAEAGAEAERGALEERSRRDEENTRRRNDEKRQKKVQAEAVASEAHALPALQRQSWWSLPRLVTGTSGVFAVAVIAVLFWVENRPPLSPRQIAVLPTLSTKADAPAPPVTQPPPIDSAPIIRPEEPANQQPPTNSAPNVLPVAPAPINSAPIIPPAAPQAQSASVFLPQVQEKIADAAPPRVQSDDSLPINDPGLLNEVRDRLYELNFDPGSLEGPSTESARQAIREFEQQNHLPPTGIATMGLLRRLRDIGSLKPWGAIVYGKDGGKWGMAWDENTRKAAVARARTSCGDVNSCPVEISFFGTECGVFAYSSSSWSITARDDIRKAKEAALADCRKRGKSCDIIASVCADGAERFSAAK